MLAIKGLGVLITGNSGVGKSETALELVNKGYQLISDDVVEFYLNANNDPVGRSVKPIKQWLEVRGIGVINLVSLYGVSVIIEEQKLDLVINLEKWNPRKKYDRLGENPVYFEVLGQDIPRLNFPVAAGRNVSTLIEVAVKYHISRRKGIGSFLEYSDNLKGKKESGENG
jgi:HPr kinase/phosphorylase